MQMQHINTLYTMGLTHAEVLIAMDTLSHGTPSQINKLKTELAPRLRNSVAYRTATVSLKKGA